MRQRAASRPDLETEIEAVAMCWCGAEELEPVSSDYACCGDCGTVVYRFPVDVAEHSAADGTGFYGDRYWRRHVPGVLGLPGLEERARADLPERAAFHLAKILDHLSPGSRVLELGCGAGSLTYLLCHAGFDAEGLELGPAAIEVASDRFGIQVHRGPLEVQDDPGPWDAIVAVDVLEHLPDPLATMEQCARRLADDGRLFLQTPCYRQEGAQWQMLLPEEHLHLFTEASVERLLRAASFATVEVGGSLFPHDMWVVAAKTGPLVERSEPLAGVAPIAVALLDAYAEITRTGNERDAIDADRKRKQGDIDELLRELESVRSDQAAKGRLLRRQDEELRNLRVRLETELASARCDQAAKAEVIERLGTDLKAVRSDQAAKAEVIDRLGTDLKAVRRDRQVKEELIVRLSSELERLREDQAAKARVIERTGIELESMRADQAAKQELIVRVSAELETVRADQQAKEIVIRQLEEGLQTAVAELEEIHADRRYRLLQAVGVRLGGRR